MFDPWEDFRRFEDMMNRMYEEFRGRRLLPSGERAEIMEARQKTPFIDLMETDKEIVATAEMPGLEKQDIKINLTEDRLEISAEKKHEERKEEEGYIYKEISSGSYYRTVSLPSSIDTDNSKASYKNGVLEIKMPKVEVKEKKPLKIE